MTSRPRSPADQLADALFYGPLGLLLDGRKLMPQLAKRGRRQVAFTRTIGKYAVRRGRARVDQALGELGERLPLVGDDQPDPVPAPARLVAAREQVTTNGRGLADRDDPALDSTGERRTPGPPGVDAIIDSYDSLSAVQVVPRLEGLSATDLEAVRDHEAAARARRTILAKIAQLLP